MQTLPLRLIAFATAAALVPAAARSQAPLPDTARLGPVVVTATRVAVPVGAGAAAWTVLAGDDLRARGITRVSDALADVPGLAVVQPGPIGSVTSLFLRGGESDYTKFLIDGVPVNGAGGAMDLAHLTTDNIDRIEIIRGPASVLYGSDAVAGVVQIFTRPGSPGLRWSAGSDVGTYGSSDVAASVLGGRPGAGFSLGAGRHATDGTLAFNNRYTNGTLSALGSLQGARGDLRVTTRATDALYHVPTDFTGAVTDSNQSRSERRLVVGLDAGRRLTRAVEARIALASNGVTGISDDQPDSPGDSTGFYSHDESRAWRRSADARVNLSVRPATVVTAGATVEWEHERGTGSSRFGSAPAAPSPRFDSTRTNTAWYAQVAGVTGSSLAWSAGGRIDDNQRYGTFRTARAGASYYVPTGTRLRGAIGSAFREPAFSEVYNTAFSTGNPSLRPEQTRSWEAGVEQRWLNGRAMISATWFDQTFRDLIQYLSSANPADTNYFNVGRARARGLEAEVTAPPVRAVTASLTYTQLRTAVLDSGFGAFGTFTLGKSLLRRPRQSAALALAWRAGDLGAARASVRYVGRRDDRDFTSSTRITQPGYAKVDLSASIRMTHAHGRRPEAWLDLRADNLFDRRYEPAVGYAAPGRTLLLGMHLDAAR